MPPACKRGPGEEKDDGDSAKLLRGRFEKHTDIAEALLRVNLTRLRDYISSGARGNRFAPSFLLLPRRMGRGNGASTRV